MIKRDLTGLRFGRLVVDSFVDKDNYGKNLWKCICDCGTIKIVMQSNLAAKTYSCGCLNRERLRLNKWKGYQEISGDYWSAVKRNALARKIDFSLKIEEAWDIFIGQNKLCVMSGEALIFGRHSDPEEQTASIDRIDSSKGYTRDNTQITHKNINMSKNKFNNSYFLEMCNAVHEFHEKQNTITCLRNQNISNTYTSGNLHKNWRGFGEIGRDEYTSIKKGAESRKMKFDVTIDFLWNLFLEQNRKCHYTGNEIFFRSSRKGWKTSSLDRTDPSIGYTKDNVKWVHKDINIMKWVFSGSQFIEMCTKVTNYRKNNDIS